MNSEDEEPLQDDNEKSLLVSVGLDSSEILLTTRNASSKSLDSTLENEDYDFAAYAMCSETVEDEIPIQVTSALSSISANIQDSLCIEDDEDFSESSAILESGNFLKRKSSFMVVTTYIVIDMLAVCASTLSSGITLFCANVADGKLMDEIQFTNSQLCVREQAIEVYEEEPSFPKKNVHIIDSYFGVAKKKKRKKKK